ncbi:MAG TPA: hypothetical protein VFJ30_06210, partial [Phycisphaerae bacterium]|nr:hypothetical protein [Phycisphaerae bacterium]
MTPIPTIASTRHRAMLPGVTAVCIAAFLTASMAADAERGGPESIWEAMSDTDYEKAFSAARSLAAGGDAATAAIEKRLKPPRADAAHVARCVADLGSTKYATRQAMAEELSLIGEPARAALEKAAAGADSAEARSAAKGLLESLGPFDRATASRRQAAWAVRVLETIDTARSRQVLGALSQPKPPTWLAGQAQAALDRLAEADRLLGAPVGTTLEFRLLPDPSKHVHTGALLSPENLQIYARGLTEKGTDPSGTPSNGMYYRWFDAGCELPPTPYASTREGRSYVLLPNAYEACPPEGLSETDPWEIAEVDAVADEAGLPAIRFELGARVTHYLTQLTRDNQGRYMAVLAGGDVLSVMRVEGKMEGAGTITGLMSRRQARAVVAAVRAGVPPHWSFGEAIDKQDIERVKRMLDQFPTLFHGPSPKDPIH